MTSPDPTTPAAALAGRTDVLVIGGGPAGLAAAATVLEHTSLSVTIVDAGHELGGQYWRQPARPSEPGGIDGMDSGLDRAALAHLHHDLATYEELVATIRAHEASGRARVLLAHHVWTIVAATAGESGYVAEVLERGSTSRRDRTHSVVADRVVLATGAHDRSVPFPGWDLPGVFTVGGLQSLLKAGGVSAGRRVVIAGTGPFLLPVAVGLAQAGAEVVGVYEGNSGLGWLPRIGAVVGARDKLGEGVGYAKELARHRVPLRRRRVVVAAHGRGRVSSVTVARVDRHGSLVPGSERTVEADAVGIGWGFTPQLDLALTLDLELRPNYDGNPAIVVDDWLRASRDGVWAAGEVTGVGGAALAVAEGRLAGLGIVESGSPARALLPQAENLRKSIRRLRRFAAAMHLAHPVVPAAAEAITPETIVCRCEEVTARAVTRAVAEHGAEDVRQVKQLTRAGMGWCQGRVCAHAVACLLRSPATPALERLVATPIPLGVLADNTGDAGTGASDQ